MRHSKGLKKLNRTSSHRKSLLRNLSVSLIKYEQIRTTLPKAKVLRPFIEKIITLSKNNDLHTIRKLHSILRDQEIVRKLVDDIGPRVQKRAGGYTRIFKFGFRYGDSAPMGIIELVDKQSKKLKTEKTKKDTTSKSKDESSSKESSVKKKSTAASAEKKVASAK
ncbi:MAG: 50S ribosomal protein L17 [Alphaproteobacteria bacterium]|nr:50S ribosomal protein L17 [Alphaproteobacteria bacterium]